MKTGTLNHIEIYVSDLKKSSEFWGWLLEKLGYQLHQEWREGKSWKLGDAYLVFVQTEKPYLDPPYHRKRTGLNHLAFHVASIRELCELKQALEIKGVPILYEDRKLAPNVLYFEDPDRVKIELTAPL